MSFTVFKAWIRSRQLKLLKNSSIHRPIRSLMKQSPTLDAPLSVVHGFWILLNKNNRFRKCAKFFDIFVDRQPFFISRKQFLSTFLHFTVFSWPAWELRDTNLIKERGGSLRAEWDGSNPEEELGAVGSMYWSTNDFLILKLEHHPPVTRSHCGMTQPLNVLNPWTTRTFTGYRLEPKLSQLKLTENRNPAVRETRSNNRPGPRGTGRHWSHACD
jgi:hypothetical protein